MAGLQRRAARRTCIRGVLVAVALSLLSAARAPSPALAKVPASYLQEDQTLAYEYAGVEGAKLGVTLPGGAVNFLDVVQASSPHVHGDALAYTSCSAANEVVIACELDIGTLAHTQHELLPDTLAHEVFHAYQAVMCGKVRSCHAFSWHWLAEGSAEWAAVQVAGADSTARNVIANYFAHPTTPLFSREYDAIGFFNHMQSVGISPWTRFKAMFTAPVEGAAYVDAIGGDDDETFLDTEASVFFRESSGWPWAERPPSQPAAGLVHYTPETLSVTGAGHEPVTVKPYADGVYHLSLIHMSSSKPVLELVVDSGYARVRSTSGSVDQAVSGDIKLCSAAGGCNCPGQPNHNYPLFRSGDLAITGGIPGAKIELVARKRCEALLTGRSCKDALPGYSSQVAELTEQRLRTFDPAAGTFVETRASNPGVDFYSTTCLFLYKDSSSIIMRPIAPEPEAGERGVEPTGLLPGEAPPEEEVFHGVIASGFNISHYGSTAAAVAGLKLMVQVSRAPRVAGIGEEAFLSAGEKYNPRGEQEYSAAGFVRVGNLTAYFYIAGDGEADRSAALGLLAAVASEL
jgi:hypothetical protein